jgi:class 3 adenylate cyclase
LADLTDQDLEKIGVASLGHRRRLLRAIGELDSVGKGTAKPASAPAAPVVPPQDTAERRQVTVMFSDLVGSTALSARMDPDFGLSEVCRRDRAAQLSGVAAALLDPLRQRGPRSIGWDFESKRLKSMLHAG